MRKGKKLFFISVLEGIDHDIHQNTISGWMRKLITYAYQHADEDTAKLLSTSTHAIRGMASSLAFKGSASLEEVLGACSWKSHSTFTSHYLKDMSGISEGRYSLGPIVAARTIVNVD